MVPANLVLTPIRRASAAKSLKLTSKFRIWHVVQGLTDRFGHLCVRHGGFESVALCRREPTGFDACRNRVNDHTVELGEGSNEV